MKIRDDSLIYNVTLELGPMMLSSGTIPAAVSVSVIFMLIVIIAISLFTLLYYKRRKKKALVLQRD